MIYVKILINGIGLKLKLPMIIEVDNQGAVELVKNLGVVGRPQHIEVRQYLLIEPKEQGLLLVKWCPGETNKSDFFTNSLGVSDFERHTKVF